MICVVCTLERSQFYPKDRTCKECRKAAVRANRVLKVDYYRQYDKDRAMRPDRVEGRKGYLRTPRGKETKRLAIWNYRTRYPEKEKAHVMTGNAIRDGRLIKQPCEVCGALRVEAHHDDYKRPLDVRWLCNAHHRQADQSRRAAA